MSKTPRSVKVSTKGPAQTAIPSPPVAGTPLRLLENPLLHLLLLAVVGLVAYSNTFHVPFVFDDLSSIVDNPVVKDLPAFLSGAGYAYNPRRFIGYLSFALNYRLGGLDVTGYHIFNLAIHIFTAWLVYIFVRLTLRTPYFAKWSAECGVRSAESKSLYIPNSLLPLLAALLFVAHPVQTQAVTYIVQRLASLATLFYLASLVFYIKARLASGDSEARKNHHSPFTIHHSPYLFFALSLISALLAMRTKEVSATLPVMVLLYEFSFFGAGARKKLLFLVPLLLTVLIIPLGMLHTGKPLGELLSDISELTRESRMISRGDYLLTQFSVIGTYIRLLFFPVNQNLDYDYPLYDSLFTPRVFFSFLFLLALLGLAIYLYYCTGSQEQGTSKEERSKPFTIQHSPFTAFLRMIAFGILWFFITLAVESSVIPISDVIFEHRLYLPSVGAFLALASGAALLFRKYPPRALWIATFVAVFILTAATWQRNLVWKDGMTLWSDIVMKSPRKARAHNNLGRSMISRERLEEAIDEFLIAVRLDPDYADVYNNLGFALNKMGKPSEAIEYLHIALRLNPNEAKIHNTLGSAYNKKGLKDLALEQFLAAVRLNANLADAHNNLGAAYGEKGFLDQAIRHLEIAVRINPDNADAYSNLGSAYGIKGLTDKAIEFFQRAVALNPDNPNFHNNLAKAYAANGLKDKEEQERNLAISLQSR